jgi:ComF family protein
VDTWRWLDNTLAALFAPACVACRARLAPARRGPVCEPCWRSVRRLAPPLCARCGDALPTWRAAPEARCDACVHAAPAFDAARAMGVHEGALRAIVHALKYHGHRGLVPPLAALLVDTAPDWLAAADAVVPVPLHAWRALGRGFNQADAIASALGPPVWRGLARPRPGRRQTGLSADERRANAAAAYDIRAGTTCPSSVVLIDDVFTTGATADACAAALKRAGAHTVRVLTVARAVKEWPAAGRRSGQP